MAFFLFPLICCCDLPPLTSPTPSLSYPPARRRGTRAREIHTFFFLLLVSAMLWQLGILALYFRSGRIVLDADGCFRVPVLYFALLIFRAGACGME